MTGDSPVIFFDGECNLCSGAVDFVLRHDRRRRFLMAPLTSEAAARRLGGDAPPDDTILLIDEAGRHERSTAVLRIAKGLGMPWSLFAVMLVVPRRARDAVYDFVARRRSRWFGQRSTCRVPSRDERDRFLS